MGTMQPAVSARLRGKMCKQIAVITSEVEKWWSSVPMPSNSLERARKESLRFERWKLVRAPTVSGNPSFHSPEFCIYQSSLVCQPARSFLAVANAR